MSYGDKGGPAFPLGDSTWADMTVGGGQCGMTLRDWFAGQAIMGLMASGKTQVTATQWFAKEAYVVADAMLEARKE